MLSNTQRFPRLGRVSISTANPNLDGTGTISSLVTAGNDGTLVKSITIKSTGVNSQGMIRIFINNGTNYFLYQEIMVPANFPTGVVTSFSAKINFLVNLEPGYSIGVSTQNAENFSIIADCFDFLNCSC